MHILLGADAEVREGVVSMICLGEMYCRCGIPMLKTRIQLPALSDGQPAEWMRSLATLTQRYAEQTLVPAVCEVYEGLPSVAEKMHFEPFEYRQNECQGKGADSERTGGYAVCARYGAV